MEFLGPVKLLQTFLIGAPTGTLALWLTSSVSLALTSAAYGFLVGPLLRLAFGGGLPELPSSLGALLNHLTLDELRRGLPWLIAVVSALKGASYYLERYSLSLLSMSFSHDQRARLLSYVRGCSVDLLDEKGHGVLQGYFINDMLLLERWVTEGWAPVLRDGLQVLALAVTALMVSGEVGGWVLLIYPLLMIPLLSLRRHLKRRARGELRELRALSQWVHEHLLRLQPSKAFYHSAQHLAELEVIQARLRAEQRSRAHLLALTPPLTELTSALAIAAGLGWFLEGVQDGRWHAEQLISLFVCLIMMYAPLKSISRAHAHWIKAQDVLSELLTLKRSVITPPTNLTSTNWSQATQFTWRELAVCRGGVELSAPITICLTKGKIVRLLGANGEGKSSLVYQLLGLNPSPPMTTLVIDDAEVTHLNVPLNERLVAWLPQGGALPTSLRSSLQRLIGELSSPHIASEQRLIASRLGVEPILSSLSARSDDERLEGLSGGERQRLSLYIVLASDRPLLILDEPELHLDQERLEALVSLLKLTRDRRACLMITHHPALIALCDEQRSLHP